jgi:plasmid stabilization system protein ParE
MRLFITEQALDDIDRLEVWLFERGLSFADGLGAHLVETIETLTTFPERGSMSVTGRYRELHVTFHANNYVVQYRARPDRVTVARIFHGLEDR